MKKMVIEGNATLSGIIEVGGSKNSAVALVPASLLSNEIVELENVPNISDIDSLVEILTYLGAKVETDGKKVKIDCREIQNKKIPESISKKLRASYYFMGALLGKYKHVEMYFPGGCSIGERPINLHLKGFEKLGATVLQDGNRYTIDAKELKGTEITLDIASVGATINLMLASVFAQGVTTIHNAAKEPHIINVADLLNQMGAKIVGAGSSEVQIEGVEELGSVKHQVVPDYIEAGTYVIAGALCGNHLKIENLVPEHIHSLTDKLKQMGCLLEIDDNSITISKSDHYQCTDITTEVYPGFPTDLQQPFSVLLCQARGVSTITETIFENRFMHIPYLNKMGANANIHDRIASFYGPCHLHGESVVATDLRAGASLILAALVASGETQIEGIEHVLRGYENIIEKLTNVGAKITMKEI